VQDTRQDITRETGYTIAEAATKMGVTSDAVYKMIKREKIEAFKNDSGQWRVVVPDKEEERATSDYTPSQTVSSELLDQLRSEISFLRDELSSRRTEIERRDEEIRRRDYIIAGLTERIPQLPAETQSKPESRPEQPVEVVQLPWYKRWFTQAT